MINFILKTGETMRILPKFFYKTNSVKTAQLPDKNLAKTHSAIANALTYLPESSSIVSVYHNSNHNFVTSKKTPKGYSDYFMGTFISYINKNKPELGELERKISDECLPINEKILSSIA